MLLLRKSQNILEAINVLQIIKEKDIPVIVWQKNLNSTERNVTHCRLKTIDTALNTFALVPSVPNQKLDFAQETTIYFKGELESLLFKTEIAFNSSGLIIITIPREFRIIEKRNHPRRGYDFEKGPIIGLAKYVGTNNQLKKFTFHLSDISKGGFSIYITEKQTLFFKPKQEAVVIELHGAELEKSLKCNVVYMQKHNIRSGEKVVKLYRLGMKFYHPLDEDILKKFVL